MTQNVQSRTRLNNGIDMPWMGLVVFKVEEGSELVEAVKAALSTVPEHRHRCGIRQRNECRSGNSRGAGRERTEQGRPFRHFESVERRPRLRDDTRRLRDKP